MPTTPCSSALSAGGNTQPVRVTDTSFARVRTKPARLGRSERVLTSVAAVDRSSPRPDLPSAVIDRARRYRARIGASGVELERGGTRSIGDRAAVVLAVGVFTGDQATVERDLSALRREIAPGSQLWIIDVTRPPGRESLVTRLSARLRRRASAPMTIERDLVRALRRARWTICAIERFVTTDDKGVSTWRSTSSRKTSERRRPLSSRHVKTMAIRGASSATISSTPSAMMQPRWVSGDTMQRYRDCSCRS